MEKVSFVIPCYCSAKTIGMVVDEIMHAMVDVQENYMYEIIMVNDASPDNTYEIVNKIVKENKNMIGINLAKNFGQHAAIMAGLHECTGDIVVCLDDDGQTPANEVFKLLQKIEDGYDAVYARYMHKQHSAFRNFGTWMNEEMAYIMLGKPRELYVSSYFAMRRYVCNEILKYQNSYPYLIGLVLRTTKNICNVDVIHRQRSIGRSGYSLKKLLALWINGFTTFSVKPLRVATAIGSGCAAMGFLYGIYLVIHKIIDPSIITGWSSLMVAVMFIGGMLMIMIGLTGEYIGRIYLGLNNSPQYVIRDTVGELQNADEK